MNSKPKMLIVDDEVNVTRTLQMIFEREGYQVTPAYSCAEALKLLRDQAKADVVVTDLNMERDDVGLEVARAAMKIRPRPVIVICTGYANVENAKQALDLRVDYMATKPVDIDEMKSALSLLLHRRALAQRTVG